MQYFFWRLRAIFFQKIKYLVKKAFWYLQVDRNLLIMMKIWRREIFLHFQKRLQIKLFLLNFDIHIRCYYLCVNSRCTRWVQIIYTQFVYGLFIFETNVSTKNQMERNNCNCYNWVKFDFTWEEIKKVWAKIVESRQNYIVC